MDKNQKQEFSRLLVASLDEGITEDEFQRIDHLLSTDTEAVEFYIYFMKIYSRFAKPGKLFAENLLNPETHPVFDNQLWEKLSQCEKNAPAVSIPPQPIAPIIQKAEPAKIVRQFNKTSLFSIIVSVAAVIFVMLFMRLDPSQTGVDVATLSDCIGAKWADIAPLSRGMRMATSHSPLLLKEGIAELVFDSKARVVIESPAEFQLISQDQIKLIYGKLYATVPAEAIGFTVNTQNARVIDLGTEFAIKANYDRSTELHVIKGKTSLIAGETNREYSQVCEGVARLITGLQGAVQDIPCHKDEFVRKINSELNLVWRGQKAAINVPNYSFETPYAGPAGTNVAINAWRQNGPDGKQGVAGNGWGGGLINLLNSDGSQIAWMNTQPDPSNEINSTGIWQLLADTYKAGQSYKLTVALARSAWNPPDDGDQMQIRLWYDKPTETGAVATTIASATVTARDLNWSNDGYLIDYTVNLSEVLATDDWAGKQIGIWIVSTVEEMEGDGDWVIDNIRLSIDDTAANPTPPNGQIQVSVQTPLSWNAPRTYMPEGYNVYIGTDSTLNDGRVLGHMATTLDTAAGLGITLRNETKYFWRVDAIEPNLPGSPTVRTGGVWSFTTEPVSSHPVK